MTRLILIAVLLVFGISLLLRSRFAGKAGDLGRTAAKPKMKSKSDKWSWVQAYDTDSYDEAKQIVARLEEEEIDCFLYEQGRKDAHGNPLKGFGVIVPRTSLSRAQTIVSRMPV